MRRAGAWLVAGLAAPAFGLVWLARPGWRPGAAERLGRVAPAEQSGAIWIHAASVGEAAAALQLVDELRRRGRSVRVSASTLTGRTRLTGARPDLAATLAPLDHPFAVEAALDRVRPAALVLVETELWPSWIAAAHRRGLPVIVVSGRISDRSFSRYRRFRPWLAPTFARLAAVAARSAEDSQRFAALGVPAERLSVCGDLKLEAPIPNEPSPELLVRLGHAPLLVAGSTHPGEEAGAVEAFLRIRRAGLEAALVLAPRHPERFAAVGRWLASQPLVWRRRSDPAATPLAGGEVLLLDSMGELSSVYGRCRSAFVGGSWTPGVGGHNVLEPAFAGRPLSFGPHTANARVAVRILVEAGAGQVVVDAEALAGAWLRDLRAPSEAAARGAAGCRALAAHEGAARRSADRIEDVLSEGPP